MKTKKKKVRSPVYKYSNKNNLKLPELLEKRQILENRIEVMSAKGWGTDRSRRALQRVNEDIEDIQGRRAIILSRHFIQRFHERVDPGATEEDIQQALVEARIPQILSTLGATGAYPFRELVCIFNEYIAVTIVDASIPKES